MNTTALRNRPQWIVLGTVVLAAAIGGALRILLAQEAPNTAAPEGMTTEPPAETAELFASPMISLSAELRKAATPSELVTSTASADRLSVIDAGRVDPFAPITQTIGAVSTQTTPATSSPNTTPVPPEIASLPAAPVSNVPDLPPVPRVNGAPPPLPVLPPIPVAANPISIPALPTGFPQVTPAAQDPIANIQLTGVVKVGDRVGVIVREGNEQSSRHLFVGDYLAGGQVRVKSIDFSSQEPWVILEYQGKEYPRIVG